MRTKFAIALAIAAVCVTAARADWDDAFQVTDNELENWLGVTAAHKVVIGAVGSVDNVVHMVWYSGVDAYYKRYWPGSGWSEELKIGSGGGLYATPGIALDANGKDIHVVWHSTRTTGKGRNKIEDQTVYYRKCVVTGPGNGGWDENPTDLCVNAVNGCWRSSPCIACGADGQVVVVWMERIPDPYVYSVVFREYVSGEWQDEYVIETRTGSQNYEPSIAADGDGNVSVSYSPTLDGPSFYHVHVARRIDGVWQDPENLTPGDDYFYHSDVEVSPEGNPHVVCWSKEIDGVKDINVYHTYLNEQGDWEDLEVVSDPAAEYAWNPRMFFDVDGVAHVVWWLLDPADLVGQAIMYASCPYEGGTWTVPVELVTNDADGVTQPDIAGGTDGTLLAVWRHKETRVDTIITKKKIEIVEVTDWQIWGKYNTPAGGGGQARPLASPQPGVELVPNPARTGRVAVRYSLPRAGQMTVLLVDISGRVVRTEEVAAHGLRGSATIDVSGLSAGVYMARLVAGDLDVSQPLVIAR